MELKSSSEINLNNYLNRKQLQFIYILNIR